MRIVLLPIIIILVLVISASAQEASMRAPHETRDDASYQPEPNELESSPKPQAVYKPDSVLVRIPPRIKTENPKPKENTNDTDAVSFNFLYYIIQRFKSSDLID